MKKSLCLCTSFVQYNYNF